MKSALIPGFERYRIYEDGRVENVKTGKPLKPWIHPTGYRSVDLCNKGTRKSFNIHRLLMTQFRPVAGMEGLFVDHIDGNKLNNSFENLRWVTSRESALHNVDLGIHRHGEGHGCAKLNADAVRQIRRRYKCVSSRESNAKELAAEFGVNTGTICRIASFKSWKHIPPEETK